jgi:general secretion pathway protein E
MKLDRVTIDLIKDGYIMKTQVERLISKGVAPELVLRDITLSGFMTKDRLIRYLVEKIRNGEYDLDIVNEYDFIKEADLLKKLA